MNSRHKKHKRIHAFLGIGTLGWAGLVLLSNLGYKVVQVYHLVENDFPIESFNIWSVFFVFLGSLAYLVYSFITKANKIHKILGITGMVFGIFIFAVFIYKKYWVIL